jgi:NAD(P)H-dependent FMN reductase
MSYQPKILAFAGSLRKDSYNKKLVKIAALGAEEAGAIVRVIDLKDYPLPLYDQEIEDKEGIPPNALALKKMMWESDGFLVAVPEYNGSMSAVFKNVIDWTSRRAAPDEVDLSCFIDKAVGIMSASPGGLGGIRGLVHVRSVFSNIFSWVLPVQKCIPAAYNAFAPDGNLIRPEDQKEVMEIGQSLVEFIRSRKKA